MGRAWKDCKGGWVVFDSQENALILIVLMVVPLYEYTKNYRFVPLQQVSCVACELHLNKAVIKHTHTQTHIFEDRTEGQAVGGPVGECGDSVA